MFHFQMMVLNIIVMILIFLIYYISKIFTISLLIVSKYCNTFTNLKYRCFYEIRYNIFFIFISIVINEYV